MDNGLMVKLSRKKWRTIAIVSVLTAFFILAGVFAFKKQIFLKQERGQTFSEYVKTSENSETESATENAEVSEPPQVQPISKPLPENMTIVMPFTTQAPFSNWDATHEEACEEASLIMLKHYLDKTDITSPQTADKEIFDLINFENKNGYSLDVTLAQLNEIAASFYGLHSGREKTDPSILDIKKEIASGRPVIIPAAGKILPNPNFRNGGPNYHMLVIKGYDNNGFITNDPGTRKGEGFRYSFDSLFNAIHDWDPNNILNGQKAYLAFD